ncbi:MAG: SRPBCC domain-containing protein [Bacteroidota bacterium]
MNAFQTAIDIHAPASIVWHLLTEGRAWPQWNPTVTRLDGHIALGQKVTVYSTVNPGRAFPLKVVDYVPERRMVWRGGMPLGLFVGERTYTLTPRDGGVRFEMHEAFRGPLAPLFTRSIPDLQPSFETFAAALKRTAESGTMPTQ